MQQAGSTAAESSLPALGLQEMDERRGVPDIAPPPPTLIRAEALISPLRDATQRAMLEERLKGTELDELYKQQQEKEEAETYCRPFDDQAGNDSSQSSCSAHHRTHRLPSLQSLTAESSVAGCPTWLQDPMAIFQRGPATMVLPPLSTMVVLHRSSATSPKGSHLCQDLHPPE